MKIILLSLFLVSCSSYIKQLHRQLDKDGSSDQKKKDYNKFNQFRSQTPASTRKGSLVSTKNTQMVRPVVKRRYTSRAEKRYRKEDFRDNSNNGSLWTSSDGGNFLFDTKIKKRIGDIVLINIQDDLKKEITLELSRDYKKRFKQHDQEKDPKDGRKFKRASSTSSKIHDKMSTIVTEEINKDHLLIKGQRQLLYRNRKRLIELQALVTRRNITPESAISSSDILETDITIVR